MSKITTVLLGVSAALIGIAPAGAQMTSTTNPSRPTMPASGSVPATRLDPNHLRKPLGSNRPEAVKKPVCVKGKWRDGKPCR